MMCASDTRGWAFACCALLAVLMASGFYLDTRDARFTDLTTDQLTALTICARNDYPESLAHDMVVGHPGSERYYLPFYTGLVCALSGPDHDYARGLSRLLFVTTVLYVIGWWFLFAGWTGSWGAIPATFFARAVLPLPGGETWGVGGLWTMLPRALFLALLPWALWLWLRRGRGRAGWICACLFAGFLVNVHPLSGFTVVFGLLAGEAARRAVETRSRTGIFSSLGCGAVAAMVGALPFLLNSGAVLGGPPVNVGEFKEALALRVPHDVLYPGVYLRQWLHPVLVAAVLLPPILLFVFCREAWREHRPHIHALLFFALGCVAAAALPMAFQSLLQALGRPVFFAIYMIRGMKYMVVPGILLWAILLAHLARQTTARWPLSRWGWVGGPILLTLIALALRLHPVSRTPFLAHSPVRFFWPEWIGPRLPPVNAGQNDGIEGALAWIRGHTRDDSRFVGPLILRVASLRSVIHDHKGAAFLIEKNPGAFLAWAEREREQRRVEREAPDRLPELYRAWGADYWATTQRVARIPIGYQDRWWTVYDLSRLE
ncbi:MAG: hypothetical protein HY343_01040 [Lentisphaerae bacterium]|nr:hypothetical protein [Lentisphaerota bacterium]